MGWVGRDLKDHLAPTPLPWAGMLFTRPGFSEFHSAWPWTVPGMGHPQLPWAACSSASPALWLFLCFCMCKSLVENEQAGASPLGSCFCELWGLFAKPEHSMPDTTDEISRVVNGSWWRVWRGYFKIAERRNYRAGEDLSWSTESTHVLLLAFLQPSPEMVQALLKHCWDGFHSLPGFKDCVRPL